MTILVTGCAGFIGSAVCEELLARGDQVHGVDSLNDAYDPRLKQHRLSLLLHRKGFRFVRGDVADRSQAAALFRNQRFDSVVHLAARAGVRQSIENPWAYLDTNALGTLNVLDATVRAGARKFVLASTSSLYGNHNSVPFREDADTSRPLSPYAASKQAAEAMTASYAHLHGIDATVLRFFTVYGPAGRPDMSVFRFIRWVSEGEAVVLHGDGSQSRDFTYVEDIARGAASALDTKGFHTINLGGDCPTRLAEVLQMVESLVGRKATIERRPAHPADVRATWADIGKARSLLHWEPRIPLEEGLARSVAWYQKNRDWARKIALGT
jgi:nucleoside-diphosphate-sugar epimerase